MNEVPMEIISSPENVPETFSSSRVKKRAAYDPEFSTPEEIKFFVNRYSEHIKTIIKNSGIEIYFKNFIEVSSLLLKLIEKTFTVCSFFYYDELYIFDEIIDNTIKDFFRIHKKVKFSSNTKLLCLIYSLVANIELADNLYYNIMVIFLGQNIHNNDPAKYAAYVTKLHEHEYMMLNIFKELDWDPLNKSIDKKFKKEII